MFLLVAKMHGTRAEYNHDQNSHNISNIILDKIQQQPAAIAII